jgi:hypothetical protein
MRITFGNLTTLLKSSKVKERPKPSMIIPNARGRKIVVIALDSIML